MAGKEEKRYQHLSLLQEPICRMSTLGALFKGFASTISAGVVAMIGSDIHVAAMILATCSLLLLAIMDIYYLRVERKYRELYNQIANGTKEPDYLMIIPRDKCFLCKAKARYIDCLKSPSIWLFYGGEIVICVIAIILKEVL